MSHSLFTLYTQPGCTRCEAVLHDLVQCGHTVEVLTDATLETLSDRMRRADLMSKITLRDRDDLPVVFRNDEIIEIENLGINP